MEEKLRKLIKELESKGCNFAGQEDPKVEINVWYVVAKLREILASK